MEIISGVIQALIPLLVLAAVIAALIAWRRGQGLEADEEQGIGTARRLYFYFGTFVFMMVASVGVVLIARYVLDELFGPPTLDRDLTPVALGVVLALIWTPVWFWHRHRVRQLAEEEPAERRSVLRKVAVYLTLGVTAGLVAQASVELLRWLFDARSFGGYPIAAFFVWAGLWAFTWSAEEEEGQPTEDAKTVRRLYLYSTATYSLAMLATGMSIVLYLIFRDAYEGLVDLPAVLRGEEALWSEPMKGALAVAMVGAALWAGHWLYLARDDRASDMHQFYLYTLAILGGVVTTLTATGIILFGVLQWGFGTPEEAAASAHFRFLPGAVAPLLVGLLLWGYHWAVVQQERAAMGQLLVAQRSYRYVMTALGIGGLAAAVITLVPTFIGIVVTSAQDILVGPDWWRDPMVLALTLALLGAPVWGYHWYGAQRSAAMQGVEERQSFPRRILLYGVIAVGVLTILGSASHLLFLFLNKVLNNELSLTLLRDGKWSMGTLVAAVVIAPYHWFVLQEDREAAGPAPARAAAKKAVTVLIAAGGAGVVEQIEAALGAKVRVLQRSDEGAGVPELSADEIAQLDERVAQAVGSRVLLVADAAGVQLFSYD